MGRKKATESDTFATKEQILKTAEQLFKEVGYAKTTIADIAASLGMSPANIYRFFKTKAQINEQVCDRLVRTIEKQCRKSMLTGGTCAERIKSYFLSYHRLIRGALLDGDKLYDMIPIAMEQNWPIIHSHSERIRSVLISLLEQGVAAGEFKDMDKNKMGRAIHEAIAIFIYPPLLERWVAEFAEAERGDRVEEQLEFLLDLLFCGACTAGR